MPVPNLMVESAEVARSSSTYVAARIAGEPRQGKITNVQPSTHNAAHNGISDIGE